MRRRLSSAKTSKVSGPAPRPSWTRARSAIRSRASPSFPPGDYFVQGLLNVYTTFHRSDGHVVKTAHGPVGGAEFPDLAGQPLQRAEEDRISIPLERQTIQLVLDQEDPADRRCRPTRSTVKHIRFESPLLSKFWGQPIWIGATVLLPKDYERDTGVSYPVNYEQGHFSLGAPGGFGETPSSPPGATEREKERARRQEEFTRSGSRRSFPRMLFVTFQHPTPYYDDSYAIDSPNKGPYGTAITEELIPYIEKHFRAIPQPWARILSGGSTGGWESLALQIFYPDYLRRHFLVLPRPGRLPLLRDRQHLRLGQRLVPEGRVAQDADLRRAQTRRPRALDDEGAARLRARNGHRRPLRRRLGLLAGGLRPGRRRTATSSLSSIRRPARSTTASPRTGRSTPT